MRIMTKRGYDFGEVSSAMQKAIRRADTRLAGYWALELLVGRHNSIRQALGSGIAESCSCTEGRRRLTAYP